MLQLSITLSVIGSMQFAQVVGFLCAQGKAGVQIIVVMSRQIQGWLAVVTNGHQRFFKIGDCDGQASKAVALTGACDKCGTVNGGSQFGGALRLAMNIHGNTKHAETADFQLIFLCVAVIAGIALLDNLRLRPKAGESVLQRK